MAVCQGEIKDVVMAMQDELIKFAQNIVQIQSYSSHEGKLAKFIQMKMNELGYDEVYIDSTGNVVGRVGNGPVSIMFDSHMDTVEVNDPEKWKEPPFSGNIADGRLYGRGAVDMKAALASSVFAAAAAKRVGIPDSCTVYVTCTVNEEDCDGRNLEHLFAEKKIVPDYYVTCEPSSNEIALGHTGKAMVEIHTKGVSAAACRPFNGVNAVYKMADIIKRVNALNEKLSAVEGEHGTVTLSNITCETASLNAVPSGCTICLDRRMVLGETEAQVRQEMDELVAGTDATWEILTITATSWTGSEIVYHPFHEAWQIDPEHKLTRTMLNAYQDVFGKEHGPFHKWLGGSNAVTPVALGVPSIGFGPGEDFLSHVSNESCNVEEIVKACEFYTTVIETL